MQFVPISQSNQTAHSRRRAGRICLCQRLSTHRRGVGAVLYDASAGASHSSAPLCGIRCASGSLGKRRFPAFLKESGQKISSAFPLL
nr:MAG TPA: hypothetical protein [Caudoviricetes sp.]